MATRCVAFCMVCFFISILCFILWLLVMLLCKVTPVCCAFFSFGRLRPRRRRLWVGVTVPQGGYGVKFYSFFCCKPRPRLSLHARHFFQKSQNGAASVSGYLPFFCLTVSGSKFSLYPVTVNVNVYSFTIPFIFIGRMTLRFAF